MTNDISWNKIRLARWKGIYFQGMADHGVAKQFQNIISLYFLAEQWVFHICYWVYGQEFYSNYVDEVTRKRKFK